MGLCTSETRIEVNYLQLPPIFRNAEFIQKCFEGTNCEKDRDQTISELIKEKVKVSNQKGVTAMDREEQMKQEHGS